MSKPRGGLGRGLAALIPTGPQTNVVSDVFMGGSLRRIPTPPEETTTETTTETAEDGSTDVDTAGQNGAGTEVDGIPTHETVASSASGTQNGRQTQDESSTAPGLEGPRYEELPIGQIRPNPRNPRTVFDEDALAELEHSLREFGLLQPIVVRQVSSGYELVMGERRLRAAQRAGLATIPAIIRRTEDAALLRDALLENIHRANLNPLEEAAAYQQLLQEFDVTQEELAVRIGRSRPVISNTIRLLKLPVPVQRRVAAGVLSAGHARALLSLEDPDEQEELATRVVAEGLSVRGTEEAVVLMAGRKVRTKRATPKKLVMPSLTALAGSLSDAFDTRVRVELGRQKGRIVVEFATVDDLERIVGIMAPAALERRRNGGSISE
jgi:ParB family chromosome partitioning protein